MGKGLGVAEQAKLCGGLSIEVLDARHLVGVGSRER